MESLRNTLTILNKDTCNYKAGQIAFTRKCVNEIKFIE